MHYQIRGHCIRSENAAKSPLQTSSWVIDWINQLPKNIIGLDYGCGKLRYSIPLAKRISFVNAIDSSQQIHRRHTVDGISYKNLIEFASSRASNILVREIKDMDWGTEIFDVILLTNVLSAIPLPRMRLAAMRNIVSALKTGGKALVVTQFTNSYFKGWAKNGKAEKYQDGWLVKSRHGASFYGLIGPEKLVEYCERSGLQIIKHGKQCHGNSAYVVATVQ